MVAAVLRGRGFDAVTARDIGGLGRSDIEQLASAALANRVLFSHNRVDFERLHRAWMEIGKPHAGIIVARRRTPVELAARVGRLLARLSADDLKNQLLYI